ncbi:MAG: hypothetical protein Q4D89_10430 [Arachnia propionica]|uniref:hypothetical protein n=1 Tax=Arachnia propionica TaxID=1750 RepID=UPI0027099E7E|nr:hypothetical protein [Arachnia propionica]
MKAVSTWVWWLIRRSWLSRRAAESQALFDLACNYVAGQDVSAAVAVARTLRRQGLLLGFTHLSRHDSESDTPTILERLLEALGDDAVGAELSVKPSSVGLRDSVMNSRAVLRDLCGVAEAHGAHVTLEMQRPQEYDDTLALYRHVREEHPMLGITIPTNFHVAERECLRLGADDARVRLCTSTYPAGRDLAITSEREKSLALVRCLRILMDSPGYPMLATHDPRIIEIAHALAHRNARTAETFEFQMFHGVRPLEHRRLADIGWRSRTCIPFGKGWYTYLATRIAARPRTFWGYARAILDKR